MMKPYGVIPAMVTPLTADEEVSEAGLKALIDHLIAGNVHGIFATGTTGEFWALDHDEKQRVWTITVEQAAGRVPVYVGTNATTTRETIALTKRAEAAGVDAVSILTPYFITPNIDQLYDHYRAIAETTSLPIILYTNPPRTGGVDFTPALVARLAEIPNIVGIKDSGGSLPKTMQYIEVTPDDFSVLMGNDAMIFPGLMVGCKGAIAGTANAAPSLVASIYDHWAAGDYNAARKAQERLAPLRQAFGLGTFPAVMKEALDLIGLSGGPCRAPVGPLTPDQREQLKTVLRKMDVLQAV